MVAARRDGGRSAEIDPDALQVRARVLGHVKALCDRFDVLRGSPIIETPRADYLYRIIVPRGTWVEVAAALAGEIDYTNFKDECGRMHEPPGAQDKSEYIWALHEVWHVGNELQGQVHGKGAYVRPYEGDDWADDPWPPGPG